jgi:hypothetical protein
VTYGGTSGSLWELFHHPKDSALAATARTFLNVKLRGIGKVTELSIDTKKKSLRVQVDLVGEAEPIEIRIVKYSIKQKSGELSLVIEDATASREWLAVALREFVIGQSISLPGKAGALLKLLA